MKWAAAWLVAYLLGYCAVMVSDTVQHEAVHEAVDTYFGCQNVTVKLEWGGLVGGSTRCGFINASAEDVRAMNFLHGLNEVFSYNLQSLQVQLFLTVLFVSLMIFVVGGC